MPLLSSPHYAASQRTDCTATSREGLRVSVNHCHVLLLSINTRAINPSRILQARHSNSSPENRALRRHLQLHRTTTRFGARLNAQVIEYLLATRQETGVLLSHRAVASDRDVARCATRLEAFFARADTPKGVQGRGEIGLSAAGDEAGKGQDEVPVVGVDV